MRDAFRQGNRRILAVLPCGGGKTVVFAQVAKRHVEQGGTVHFYVHRKELKDQALATFRTFGIPLDGIYIGMVQRRTAPTTTPTLIIFDEAHHATANTWSIITDRYPNAYVVGLTATPKRPDGVSLAGSFDALVNGVDANYLIANNYLSDFDYYAPRLSTINPKDILINRGKDYDGQAVGDVMLKSKIYGDVAKYLDPSRKTIIYAPSVQLSASLAQLGVVHVDGNTPTKERDQIIDDFRTGKTMWLSNVDLFGEGFDVPDCEVVIMLRPTKSSVLFIQQSMRALRYVEGKRATIYDLVGNVFTHGLPTNYSEWTLDGTIRKTYHQENEVSVRECSGCYRVYRGSDPVCPYCEHNNGKTAKQIKIEEQAELEKIEDAKRREASREQGMATTMDELISLGIRRGYKNPRFWAKKIYESRKKNI